MNNQEKRQPLEKADTQREKTILDLCGGTGAWCIKDDVVMVNWQGS